MGGFLLRIKTWWQAADRTQKLITVCGGGFLVVLLIGTYIFASRPKMELLFNGLTPEDTGSVAMELETMGIAVTFDTSGNVFVPSEKRAQARASLAMKGKLPKAGNHMGDDFKNINMFGDQKVMSAQLKSISQNEIAQSIQFFDGVDSSNVQVTPAVDSPFELDKKPAQANVTVSEKPGSIVSDEQARAMANLVASAVPGLDKKNVTIFTRTGRALWDGKDLEDSSANGSKRLAMQKIEARKRRDDLQGALNQMLGPGNAIAMVDLTLDLAESDKTIQSDEPTKNPMESHKVSEKMTNGGTTPPLPPTGAAGNGVAEISTTGGGGTSSGEYDSVQTHVVNGHHQVLEHIKKVPGEIQTMAITVLVNQTKTMPENVKVQVQELADSFLGPKIADTANFTAKVVQYPFDTTQAVAAKKAEEAASSGNRMQQIMSILPIAALLIVGFLVVRSISKLTIRQMPVRLLAAGGPALQMSNAPGGSIPLSALHAPSRASDGADRFILPEVVKQKALEAGISEEQLQAAIEEAGDAGISIDDIPSIKSKINVPLEQIKKMASERPEAVAMLVKSWLIEEGIRR